MHVLTRWKERALVTLWCRDSCSRHRIIQVLRESESGRRQKPGQAASLVLVLPNASTGLRHLGVPGKPEGLSQIPAYLSVSVEGWEEPESGTWRYWGCLFPSHQEALSLG